jgi:guanyl-specific ribonuclease Sa
MSGVVRDFSVEAVQKFKSIINEISKDGQWAVFDFVDDVFMDNLDIRDNLNNLDSYHKHVMDKNDIGLEKFGKILNKVSEIDNIYAAKAWELAILVQGLNEKITDTANLMNPSAVVADPKAVKSLSETINNNYELSKESYDETSAYYDAVLEEALKEDPRWWETALSAVGGFAVSVTEACILEPALFITSGIDAVFGTDITENTRDSLEKADQWIVKNWVSDEGAYYNGRVAGDVAGFVVGVAEIVYGVSTILGGITITAGGIIVSATGVGAVVGAPAIAISLEAVAAGVAMIGVGGATASGSASKIDEHKEKAKEAGSTPEPKTPPVAGPDKAKDIAKWVRDHNGAAPPGHKGNRAYRNQPKGNAQKLPAAGEPYKYYDIHPEVKGVDRGEERLVLGNDGSTWYTDNHYETFTKL